MKIMVEKSPGMFPPLAFSEIASGNVTELNVFGFRESVAVFDQLCQTFPDENCVLTSREILTEVRTHHLAQELLTL